MCGRFTLRTPLNLLVEQLMLDLAPAELPPRYNIAPTQMVAVVRQTLDGRRALEPLRWGLIPSWAKDKSIGNRLINARAESVAEKPAFRAAFKRRRCLVPADGYFEWKAGQDGKQPFLIQRRDRQPFVFAGLWESWQPPDATAAPREQSTNEEVEPWETFTVITTDANAATRAIHDRMPVILPESCHAMWLDPTFENHKILLEILRPYEAAELDATPVERHVNSPRHDDPQCVQPLRELF